LSFGATGRALEVDPHVDCHDKGVGVCRKIVSMRVTGISRLGDVETEAGRAPRPASSVSLDLLANLAEDADAGETGYDPAIVPA